jgi:hypothetical protein
MNIKLLSDLIVLLLVLGLTAITLWGWGKLTWRFLGIAQPPQLRVLTVWLGFCILVALLEIIHLFVEIDWRVTFVFVAVGMFGCRFSENRECLFNSPVSAPVKKNIRTSFLTSTAIKHHFLVGVTGFLIIVTWCLLAMRTPLMFDSGLYHFGSIRWLNEHPIVPGLGNLHWRLALNQSYFGFLAFLNIEPYWGRGYAAGGLFLLLLTTFTLFEVAKAQSLLWKWIFGGILFSFLCLLSVHLANPIPDTAIAILQVTIFLFLFCTLTYPIKADLTDDTNLLSLQVVLLFLCLTITTIKLSSLGFAATSFMLVVVSIFRQLPKKLPGHVLIRTFGLIGLFALVHIGRSYLLSGTPFFPSPFGGIWSLSWAVPFGVASHESQLIYAWAKQPGVQSIGEVPLGFGWMSAWWLTIPKTIKYLLVTSTLLILPTLILRHLSTAVRENKANLIFLPIGVAFAFWFFTAPDPRFLGATVILYFTLIVYVFLLYISERITQRVGKFRSTTRKALSLMVILGMGFLFVRWSLFSVSAPSGWSDLPLSERVIQANRMGYQVYVPTKGTQCWNSELPCTFVLDDGLTQRPLSELVPWLRLQPHRFSLSIQR